MTAFLVPSEGSARRGRLTKSHFAKARRSLTNIPNIPSTSFRHPEQQQQQQSLHALNAFSQGQALTSAALVTADANVQVFEPVMPDTSGLVAMGGVVVISFIAAQVWNNSVVPISRTKLAISKSRGEVKQYLDGLEEGAAGTATDTRSSDDISEDVETRTQSSSADAADSDGRDFERWLFTDWLEGRKGGSKAGRQKEPALPILKSAKWNSGDNPVVVTSALMFLGVIIASLTERAGSMM
jgi:hypothetical protein